MSDLIDRKIAVQGVRELFSMGECYCDELSIVGMLNGLPSQPKWIPVTERLPEDSETVLITHKCGVSFGWYNGRYWERGASTNHRPLQTVIAWQPLPEPWRGE